MTKRLQKKENNISSHSGHSNSLSGDVRHLAVEVNQTMKTAICIFLAVATFSVYLQVKDHEFIDYDDKAFISQNSNIKSGLSKESVIWAFTTTLSGSWEPITWLSHILGYQLYGSSSKNHHLINVFFHITNAVLLFIVLLRMTGALWQSGFVACMFALHPMNVESVAWLMERNMLLCTLFWLLTMLVYIHYTEKPSIKRYSLVILFFTFGLMSKSMIVTLPFVLLMMDYWPLKRLKVNQKKYNDKFEMDFVIKRSEVLRLVLEKIPLLILSLGLSITIFKLAEGYEGTDYMAAVSFFGRLNNGMVSYLEYLAKTVWPTGLAVLYPHPLNTLATWKGILCGMALLGVTFFSIRFIKKSPYFAFGWFWYLGVLVPVIGIFVQVGGELAMADRYAYLPLIGIFIIIAWGLPELIARWRHREKILSISAGIIISMLMATTWIQLSYWKNSLDLFKRAISVANKKDPNFKNPNHALLYNHLGLVFYNMGKPEESTSHYEMAIKIAPDLAMAHTNLGISYLSMGNTEEAISHYKTAIKFNPNHAHGHYNLGIVLFALGKIEEAISHYQTAIKLNPNYAAAHNNLGLILEGNGRTREAISNYRTAINLKPGYAAAHSNLGNTLFALGKTEEAIVHYKKAIRLNPDFAMAYTNLGNALFALGKTEEAIYHFKTAIRLKPGYTEAHHNLGVALFAIKKVEESISHYKMAIKFKPDYPMAYTNLGNALFTLGKTEKAISHYKTAIRLRPDYTEAHYNLGNILVQTGEIKEAVGHYRETLRLKPNFVLAQKNLERALLLAGKMEKFKNQPIKNLSD